MRSDCFLDTNVLIYAAAGRIDDPRRHNAALDLIRTERFGLSGQVLAEFYAVSTRKFADTLRAAELDEWIEMLSQYPLVSIDAHIVRYGVALSRRFHLSYWDAALIAAAERLDAPILYTEDLNHGQLYGSVRVVNPFLPA